MWVRWGKRWDIQAIWQIKSGKLSSHYYLRRRKLDHLYGQSDNSSMAYLIGSRTVVIGATCPEIYHHIQRWSGDPPSSLLALSELVWGGCYRSNHDPITSKSTRTSQKKPEWTTLIMIDSQAVKNTCNASIESKGFCFYKCTNGIKRHLAVDILGFPFFTHCTKAAGRVTRHAVCLTTKVWLKCFQTTSIISNLNQLSYPRSLSCWITVIILTNWLKL